MDNILDIKLKEFSDKFDLGKIDFSKYTAGRTSFQTLSLANFSIIQAPAQDLVFNTTNIGYNYDFRINNVSQFGIDSDMIDLKGNLLSGASATFTNLNAGTFSGTAGFLTNFGVTNNFSASSATLSSALIRGNLIVSNPAGNTRLNLVSNGGGGNNIEFGFYNGATQLAFFATDSVNTFEFENPVNNGNLHFNVNNGTTRFYRTGVLLLEVATGTSRLNTNLLISNASANINLTGASATITINGRNVATLSSDRILKSNIETFTNPLDYINRLRGVTFNWKDLQNPGETIPGRQLGMIAQEVEEVMPNLGVVDFNPDGTKYIKYDVLSSMIIEGIQEQQVQITSLSNAISVMNLASMQSVYDQFMTTVENLSMSTENGSLVVNTNLTVTGEALFNNATFTGDVAIGQIKFDSLNNDISINGMDCTNIDGTLNTALCETQTLFVMKNKAGNLNFFDGKVVINPLGEMTVEKITAGEVAAAKVKASEYQVVAGSEVSGNTQILSGQTEITIITSKVKSNSKVFVTANGDLQGKSLYISDKVDGVSFKVKLNQALTSDVNFDWFILNSE